MKNIEFKSNYGNFAYGITATVPDGGSEALMVQGLANIAYRVAGSSVDKALNLPKEGKDKRKAVAFSEANKTIIETAVATKLNELAVKDPSLNDLRVLFTVTGQHVFGEAAGDKPTKEATDTWTAIQQLPGEKFAAMLKNLGLGEDYTDEQGILAVKKKLVEARAKATADAMAELGAVK